MPVMEKEQILDKLSNMPAFELDKMKDKKLLELKDVLKQYHIARDNECEARFKKREKLVSEGNSYNKAEQILRVDKDLHELKRKVMYLSSLKNDIKLCIEMINNYYWKNKT